MFPYQVNFKDLNNIPKMFGFIYYFKEQYNNNEVLNLTN